MTRLEEIEARCATGGISMTAALFTTEPAAPVSLTLPYPPSANRYWRRFKGMIVVSPEARAYRNRAAGIALAAGARPQLGAVSIVLRVFRPQKRGDLDNSIKVLLDSLKRIAYEDDDQIVKIEATRHDDKRNPRVEVEVRSDQRNLSEIRKSKEKAPVA